jgi:phenylacetate-CoA ligase
LRKTTKGSTNTKPDSYNDQTKFDLDQTLTCVPFYKQWKVFDKGSSFSLADRMSALPVLTKRDLRANVPNGFIHEKYKCQEGFASGEIEMESTSGTAEERVSVVWYQKWWDKSEQAAARLNTTLKAVFQSNHREAVLTTPLCSGNICHIGEATMEERTIGNLLFLNQTLDPTAWDNRSIHRMTEELKYFQPDIIEADPAYLAILSRMSLIAGYPLYQPKCIVLTYEFPSHTHYRQIHRAFPGIPVISSYGSTETGHVFTQCEAGNFHQNIATCHVDIQPFREEFGNPGAGRILVSTVGNPWFVLLRYDVGDLASVNSIAKCPCGRSEGLRVDGIEGRLRDITFDTKGRIVTVKHLDDALKPAEALLGYKVVQTAPQHYSMYFEAEPGAERNLADVLSDILHTLYGKNAVIEISQNSALTPEQSGKFRLAHTAWELGTEEIFK